MPVKRNLKPGERDREIELYILTGFLGSGKTTLLNYWLNNLRDQKAGVIVNEFGEINVDAEVIEYEGYDGDTGLSEINNGSIFCSCLSGSFVQTIVDYQGLPLDYLLAESSGMSRPGSIEGIIDQVEELAPDIKYKGMICIVDAPRFLTVVKSLKAVGEQVAYSDLIVINKIDLVEGSQLEQIEEEIRKLNPEAAIIRTNYGQIDPLALTEGLSRGKKKRGKAQACELDQDRSVDNRILEFEDPLSRVDLKNFVEKVAPYIYRIKGFVNLKDQSAVHIDGVRGDISIKEIAEVKQGQSRLVIFSEEPEKVKEIRQDCKV